MQLTELPVAQIRANPRQPRLVFDDERLAELAASIEAVGLLQPVVVRPADDGYELVAGERRWRAVKLLGWHVVPAVVRQTEDDELLRAALLENLQRAELNPLEEAAAYQQLLTDLGGTHEELAAQLGRSRSAITNTIRLLRLPPAVQRRVAVGVLSQGHARALLALPNSAEMEQMAQRIVSEGLSVRSTEELVSLAARGSAPARRRGRSTARQTAGDAEAAAASLADLLDTRVAVTMGRSKGRLTIEFAGMEDLARITELLGIGTSASR
ncbi:MAG: ParB/RepB/Spo0J family partition protein [Candidatus Nanopelagicales bacterium]